MSFVKIVLRSLLVGIICAIGASICAEVAVDYATKGFTFDNLSQIPHNKTGLLLGTSHALKGGGKNPFFYNRITAAVELFQAGKIDDIIVSGDNQSIYYNEPEDMRRELLKAGIPVDRIYLDYAGLGTLDSIVRCKEIFGQQSFTVISQKFHNQWAVFLGRVAGMDVIGYNAWDIDLYDSMQTHLREPFARVAMFIDLLIHNRPHFLGKKVKVN